MAVRYKDDGTDSGKAGFWANLSQVPLAEKILCIVAILVLVGWLATGRVFWNRLFEGNDWFARLSFLGALTIAGIVILKLFGKRPLPPGVEKHVIPVASLLPILGLMVESLKNFQHFLCLGGSLALAYISASTYWKKHIPAPDLSAKPPGQGAAPGQAPSPAPPAEPGPAEPSPPVATPEASQPEPSPEPSPEPPRPEAGEAEEGPTPSAPPPSPG